MTKKTKTTVVAAHPGWSLVEPVFARGTPDPRVAGVYYMPIIAWACETGFVTFGNDEQFIYSTRPITAEFNSGKEVIILRGPDGALFEPGISGFNDEAEVIERFQDLQEHYDRLDKQEMACSPEEPAPATVEDPDAKANKFMTAAAAALSLGKEVHGDLGSSGCSIRICSGRPQIIFEDGSDAGIFVSGRAGVEKLLWLCAALIGEFDVQTEGRKP